MCADKWNSWFELNNNSKWKKLPKNKNQRFCAKITYSQRRKDNRQTDRNDIKEIHFENINSLQAFRIQHLMCTWCTALTVNEVNKMAKCLTFPFYLNRQIISNRKITSKNYTLEEKMAKVKNQNSFEFCSRSYSIVRFKLEVQNAHTLNVKRTSFFFICSFLCGQCSSSVLRLFVHLACSLHIAHYRLSSFIRSAENNLRPKIKLFFSLRESFERRNFGKQRSDWRSFLQFCNETHKKCEKLCLC